ncbi:MAG: sn-glycerol-1-phosphate dehydrogenase [Armatimonadetes bacterium]|nr:sn-glycerol-1-phosphate dehydrogenase [Armatimonadota bacterium]
MTTDLNSLLGRSFACACGQTHSVPTREVDMGRGALDRLRSLAERHLPDAGGVLIADRNTWDVCGRRAHGLLAGIADRHIILAPFDGEGKVHADDVTLAGLCAALPGDAAFLVCIGSGTLNDLTKLAASAAGIPSLCVATAPSMNGYPSAIAAITVRGVKSTQPCQPPVAICCDTDVFSAAPREMIQAGFGDLLSKNTSSADWLMAHLLTGEHYCERCVQLVTDAECACRAQAASIGAGEPKAIELLMDGLIRSGVSMAMAGSSSPASGGEHLLSHYWDMTAAARGRKPDLHGRQVAIGTLLAARLYELLRRRTMAQQGRRQRAVQINEDELRRHFEPLVGEQTADEIASLSARKAAAGGGAGDRIARLDADAPAFWQSLEPLLIPASQLKASLAAAGVPTSPGALGLTGAEVRSALLYARCIRDRYTVLDLAADLGLLEELVPEVMAVLD